MNIEPVEKDRIIRSGALDAYDNNDFPFTLSWVVTGKCPYHCSYCYESDRPRRQIEPDLSKLLIAMARLKPILKPIEKERQLRIILFGGEPLAHKSFLPFLQALRENFPTAIPSCLSNAFRPLDFFKSIVAIAPNFNFSFSVHFESLCEEVFLEKLRFLQECGSNCHLSIQFLPSMRERVKEFTEFINKQFPTFRVTIQFLRTRESGFKEHFKEYTEDDFEWAKSIEGKHKKTIYFIDYLDSHQKLQRKTFTFQEAFKPELSNFKGAHCVWNMRRLRLTESGWLDFGFCIRKPRVNLFDENYSPIDFNIHQPVICDKDFCYCHGMRDVPKFFDPDYAPLYLGGKTSVTNPTGTN